MNKEKLETKIFSIKTQVETITNNIESLKKIRKETADRLFEAKQEMYKLENEEQKEDKGCACGYEVEEGSEGCGKVIEEWVRRCSNEEIVDTGWYHCGENGMLCDDCKEAKRDVLKKVSDYTEGVKDGK